MKSKSVMLAVTLLASIGLSNADEFKLPPMKDGLWEVHTIQTRQGRPLFDTSVKMCQTKESTQAMQSSGDELRKKNQCTSKFTKSSPTAFVEESHCALGPNAGKVAKVTYTFQGDTASHMEMRVNGDAGDTVMTTDSKYQGACPAGMKPGDSVTADGTKISGGN